MKRLFLLKYCILVLSGLIYINSCCGGQDEKNTKKIPDSISKETIEIFNQIKNKAEKNNWEQLTIAELIGKIGYELIGIPYLGSTLDIDGEYEQCRVNLTGMDCVTFFENVLCMSRIIKKNDVDFQSLISEITFTRYRNGILSDYTSRLHYTADWIYDNTKKGVLKDITKDLGGIIFPFKLDFMSQHPQLYPALKFNPKFVGVIKKIEDSINSRKHYYIPKDKIEGIESRIQTGDIIAFATNLKGLDYSHIGIAYRDENNIVRLLHASSTKKEVVLDKSISEYINPIKKDIGITILRPSF